MAPIITSPSLYRLLSLDKDVKEWGERLQQAADIAGIPLETGLDASQIQKLSCRSAAHGRAEWVLRWLLEKLQTEDGRRISRTSPLTFVLLRRLLFFVPPSVSARLLNSNDFLDIIKNYLEETAAKIGVGLDESNQPTDSGSSVTLDDSQPISKKRKRTKNDYRDVSKSTTNSTEVARNQQENLSSLGSLINEIIHLADSSNEIVDAVASQHFKSVIRICTADAAELLSAWLHCVLKLWQSRGTSGKLDFDSDVIMRTHFAIIQIWCSRSLEIDDDTGASASSFSRTCLVPAVSIYAQIRLDGALDESQLHLEEMISSLEQLLARHVFIPGRASFSTKKSKLSGTQNALIDFLEPLRAEIVRLFTDDDNDSLRTLVAILPSMLEQAIKLCPRSSPKQKIADASWIEYVIKLLSACAGEPIPFEESDSPKPPATLSPMRSMLQIVQKSKINLSTGFLESLLVGYGGLDVVNKRKDMPVRWDLVIVLLELSGSMFLIEKPKDINNPAESDYTNKIPPHVEALVETMENTKWESSVPYSKSFSNVSHWSNSVEEAVTRVLVPLMHAYNSARNLSGFMDLWFRELRRHWEKFGGKQERELPWASKSLRHEFQIALETALTPARINERLVEYITPVKVLLNEAVSNIGALKWTDLPTIAPASVSLFMLDTVLHGVQNAETLQGSIRTWNALKDLSTQFAKAELQNFACSYKIWSILTQIYTLSRSVDGEKAFQEQLVLISSSKILDGALSVVAEVRPHQVDGFQFEAAREAYQFVVVVSSDLLGISDFKESAEHYISTANNFLLHKISRLNPVQIFQPNQTKEDQALSRRLKDSIGVLITCPRALSVFTPHERRGIFETIFYYSVLELDLLDMQISFPALLEALSETVMSINPEVKVDFVLTLISMFDKAKAYKQPRLSKLALDILLKLSELAIVREEREAILDQISDRFGLKEVTSPIKDINSHMPNSVPLLLKELSIMIKFMGQKNPTSKLCTDAAQIWNIARVCDRQSSEGGLSKPVLLNLEALFYTVIRQATIDATSDRKEAFTKSFTEQASLEYTHTSLLTRPAILFLLKSWVHVESESSEFSKISMLSNTSLFVQKTLNYDISLIGEGAANEVQQWATIRALSAMPLTAIEPELNSLTEILRNINGPNTEVIKAVVASGTDPKKTTEVLIRHLQDEAISPQDHGMLMRLFEDQLLSLRPAGRVAILNNLMGDDEKASGRGRQQLLSLLIKSLTQSDASVFVEKDCLLVQLCQRLLSSKDIGNFGTSISCINIILRTKSWLVNQHGIDTLLSTLTMLVSSLTQLLPKEYGPFIYLRLCQTAAQTVLLYRKHLGGRMHLLVPLLQNLMTCLFKPRSQYGTRSVASLPPWLFNTSGPLTKEHSKAYTRLLSTLCSPTSSSTSLHRRHAELTDTNKQAKEYAGQYLPYVLMHYCSLQLNASMSSEVSEGLKPGIWEMMAVVGIEEMRGMNVGMGRDERAIWGVVYNEWLRVGRGR